MKKDSLVYVNTEIKSSEEDIIGFSAQVDSIADAIENGASMVGVIADYGSGKSSIGELLEAKKQFKKPIRVNMWDSLKSVKPDNLDKEDLIALDKSFLYQIAYNSGNKGLARHVNKRMNKSNGFISFTLKSWKFWLYFFVAALLVGMGIFLQASDISFNILLPISASVYNFTINNQIALIAYYKLSNDNKNKVLDLYEEIEPLEEESGIIDYIELTGDLLEALEKRLLDIIKADGIDNADWDKYITLLNKVNRFNDTTIDIIKCYNYEDALPPAVTTKLLELGETKGYIIGKTLYNNKFEYEAIIPLEVYIKIYVEQKTISKYMVQNDEFLVAIYQNKLFSSLSKEQLFVFNSWEQSIELITAVMEKCETIDERKNYIMKINKLATAEDSDALQKLICNGKYDDLLEDEEITNRIRYLLWEDHYWIKGKFTRYINKNIKKAS